MLCVTSKTSPFVAVALLAFLVSSCSAPSTSTPILTHVDTPTLPPAATAISTRSPGLPTPTAGAPTIGGDAKPSIETFAKNLTAPWAIEQAPDGRFFVTERGGRVRVIKGGQLQSEPWITLPVTEFGESGLLGLALDPRFEENHFIYVAYTFRDNLRLVNRLVRLREDANGKGRVDKILIDNIPANLIHDGGRVKFGPDGKLYWTMGETNDRPRAQDMNSLNGKILRLEADGTIPADNPFSNSYIYSYGHRNPQGLAWQPGTSRLYETEHGPSGIAPDCCRDEVNLIERGGNFGWPTITGDQTRDGVLSPILQSGNDITWAPSGATFVTRGPWTGSLLFTGLRGVSLYRVTIDKNNPRKVSSFERLYQNQYGRLRDVYEARDGTLYILTSNRDGRGIPGADDDRVLKLTFK